MLKIKKRDLLWEGKFIKIWGKTFLDQKGKELLWECADKKDVVIVLPITEEGKIVLIKNFRIPVEKYVVEVPAGLMDKEGETASDCVGRELFDETGYKAKEIISIGQYAYAPGSFTNVTNAFIATGCKKIAENNGDDCEDISVFEIEPKELLNFCMSLPKDTLYSGIILGSYFIAKEKKLI